MAVSTRMDRPAISSPSRTRRSTISTSPPPVSGLGSKIGLDATNKMDGETNREWGEKLDMDDATKARVDAIWAELGIG